MSSLLEITSRSEIQAELAKRKLSHFIKQAWHVIEPSTPLIWNWHLDAICEHLEAVSSGQIQNLLINQPPGTMKSICTSVCWPVWEWLSKPQLRIIGCSYAEDLAVRDVRKGLSLIQSDWFNQTFNPKWSLTKTTESMLSNSATGFRMGVGIGGQSTGHRGDRILVDDPLNVKDSLSKAAIEAVLWWWSQSMANRLNSLVNGRRVIVMQRVHENDLSGYVLKEGGWVHLCLPMEYDPKRSCVTVTGFKDPRTTEKELLFPQMFPRSAVEVEKKRLGSYGYGGQHQQSPEPDGGGKFKRAWFRYYKDCGSYYLLRVDPLNPALDKRVMKDQIKKRVSIVDTAMTTKTTSDCTAIGTFEVTKESDILWLDLLADRLEDPEVKKSIKNILTSLKPLYMGIENKQNGMTAIQELIREGLPIRAIKADTDKVTRAAQASIMMENSKIFFPEDKSWVQDIESQLSVFPKGAHDDIVDVLSNMCIDVSQEAVQFGFRVIGGERLSGDTIIKEDAVIDNNRSWRSF